MTKRLTLLLCTLASIAGCDGGGDIVPADGAPISGDASATLDAAVPREAGPLPDAARGREDGDGNVGFSTAATMTVGGAPATGTIDGDDDYDYLRFEATAGQWIAVLLPRESGGGEPGRPTFPASITLVSSDMIPLASSSDVNGCSGVPDLERELVTHVARSGTYYVEVYAGFAGGLEGGMPWTVRVVDLATSAAALIASETSEPRVTTAHACVLAAFETASDVDTLAIDLPSYRAFFPYSPSRHGSTGGASALEVWSGETLVSRAVQAVIVDDVGAPVLRVHGPGVLGANDHAVVRVSRPTFYGPDVFHVEASEAANDAFATPELLLVPPPEESGYPSPFVTRVREGDVDHFAIDATTPSMLELACQGEAIGSAVRGLELRLLNADGSTRSRAEESGGGVRLTSTLAPGRHVLRMEAMGRDAALSSDLVVCTVALAGGGGGR